MHHRRLGRTELKPSILGIGSSPFRHGRPEDCARLLEQAMELGINYYDTARSYVHGEETIGCLPPDKKDRLIVTTKTGARGGKHCLRQMQESLRTLGRDRIDIWMTHMLATESEYEMCTALGGFCDIAVAAKQAGLIRAFGASFHAHTEVILRAIEERAFDVVMFPFNLIGRETVFGSSIRSYREQLLPAAQKNGVGVVTMKALAGGEMRHGAPGLRFVADAGAGRNELGGAVRYATMNPRISCAVVGMSSTEELVRNVAAVDGVGDHGDLQFNEWTAQAEQLAASDCTRCGECLDVCPHDIEIPKVFRLHDQQRFFGMDGVARHKYAAMPADASACSSCRKCEEVCPEDFDIPLALQTAHQSLGVVSAGGLSRTRRQVEAVLSGRATP